MAMFAAIPAIIQALQGGEEKPKGFQYQAPQYQGLRTQFNPESMNSLGASGLNNLGGGSSAISSAINQNIPQTPQGDLSSFGGGGAEGSTSGGGMPWASLASQLLSRGQQRQIQPIPYQNPQYTPLSQGLRTPFR